MVLARAPPAYAIVRGKYHGPMNPSGNTTCDIFGFEGLTFLLKKMCMQYIHQPSELDQHEKPHAFSKFFGILPQIKLFLVFLCWYVGK